MTASPDTESAPRSIRDMLMTYGYNGGKRLTDTDLAVLLVKEILTLPEEQQDVIMAGMVHHDIPDVGNAQLSFPS